MNAENKPSVTNSVSVELAKDKDCHGSVRFGTQDKTAIITNVYVSRQMPGISEAKRVLVTLEILE